MKNYDETIETVFQRMEEYKTAQNRKRRALRRAAASLGCLCLMTVACLGLWKSGVLPGTMAGHPGNSGNNSVGSHGKADASETDKTISEEKEAKKDAGDLYVVAKDYRQVYEALGNGYARDMAMAIDEEDVGTSIVSPVGVLNETAVTGDTDKADDFNNNSATTSYSKTNLQTAGVDESDIIKTDGSYIYTVNGNTVFITDVREREMKTVGEIRPAADSASDKIIEMYVDGDIVNLIISRQESTLKKNTAAAGGDETDAAVLPLDDTYYFDTAQVTELLTYDISDRKNPVLKGTVTQAGSYQTSRKIGDIVYLFTGQYLSRAGIDETVNAESDYDWIPQVNGKAVAADCIYIPEQGNSGLIIASVDIREPQKVLDDIMIVNDYAEIYVSTTAIYLYKDIYTVSSITEIAKFSMEQGILNAVGAANVPGTVRDTFAIHEYQGRLRILTTEWSNTGSDNKLFLFDEKLELVGKLEGLAPGEEIYSARFLQNMAYFVTYRNTDPLFAVDLSDESAPKVLSELKITGFSEYLHFWGKDKLIGIGYETDPETGRQKGLKITMFDISDPADLKVAGTCVLGNISYSPVLYQYKCVLVDETENLIGFAAQTNYQEKIMGYSSSYLLLSWENGGFVERMTESLTESSLEQYRGIYIDDMFYLACPDKITSYDRTDGYRCVQVLEF